VPAQVLTVASRRACGARRRSVPPLRAALTLQAVPCAPATAPGALGALVTPGTRVTGLAELAGGAAPAPGSPPRALPDHVLAGGAGGAASSRHTTHGAGQADGAAPTRRIPASPAIIAPGGIPGTPSAAVAIGKVGCLHRHPGVHTSRRHCRLCCSSGGIRGWVSRRWAVRSCSCRHRGRSPRDSSDIRVTRQPQQVTIGALQSVHTQGPKGVQQHHQEQQHSCSLVALVADTPSHGSGTACWLL
jgi:hypothetical protein